MVFRISGVHDVVSISLRILLLPCGRTVDRIIAGPILKLDHTTRNDLVAECLCFLLFTRFKAHIHQAEAFTTLCCSLDEYLLSPHSTTRVRHVGVLMVEALYKFILERICVTDFDFVFVHCLICFLVFGFKVAPFIRQGASLWVLFVHVAMVSDLPVDACHHLLLDGVGGNQHLLQSVRLGTVAVNPAEHLLVFLRVEGWADQG